MLAPRKRLVEVPNRSPPLRADSLPKYKHIYGGGEDKSMRERLYIYKSKLTEYKRVGDKRSRFHLHNPHDLFAWRQQSSHVARCAHSNRQVLRPRAY